MLKRSTAGAEQQHTEKIDRNIKLCNGLSGQQPRSLNFSVQRTH